MKYTTMIAAAFLLLLQVSHSGDTWKIAEGKGNYQLDGRSLTVRGDNGFLLCRRVDGDFEFHVRIVGLSGNDKNRSVTLHLLPGLDADARDAGASHRVRVTKRGGPGKDDPVWLRLERQGRNTAMFRSGDGRRFLNRGGRSLPAAGPVYIGIELAGKGTTAVLDAVRLTPGVQRSYKTSWVGNSLPGPVTDTVSFNMTGLHVRPDGTCLTTSFFEEQGHCLAAYKDGKNIGPGRKTVPAGIAVTSNGKYVFASHKTGFHRLEMDLTSGRKFVKLAAKGKGHETVRGLAANAKEVFASHAEAGRIEVFDCGTLEAKRQFDFIRPGPMCFDPKGRLWVIREGFEKSTYDFLEGPYKHRAEIVRVDIQTGKVLQTVTGPEIPTGIAFDRRGRLYVADNGKDQQVKIYDVANGDRLVGTLGTRGGMFAGTMGKVTDGKFNGLTGVGVDAKGKIYVSSTGWPFCYISPGTMANAVTLRAFAPNAISKAAPQALWKLESIAYIFDGATLDPKDETQLYAGADQVFAMDWSEDRGREGTYRAFTSNLRDFTFEALGRRSRCTPWIRWIDGVKFLVLAGNPGLCFYRFEPQKHGETAVPCAVICARSDNRRPLQWPAHAPNKTRQPWIWMDGINGQPRDGKAQAQEYLAFGKIKSPGGVRWDVDGKGDVWHTGWHTDELVVMRFAGVKSGVPTWNKRQTIAGPEPFMTLQRSRYDVTNDTMVLAGSTQKYPGHGDVRWRTTYIARYPNWSKGNRKSAIEFVMAPTADDYYMDGAVGFDVVDDFLYTTGRPGNVKVYDLRHGNRVMEFVPGVEVNGAGGYFDRSQSAVQAFRLSSGEYVALCQENGWCKILMYRWKPQASPKERPETAPEIVAATMGSGRVKLAWRTATCGLIKGYNIQRAANGGAFKTVNAAPVLVPTFLDRTVTNGTSYRYRVTIVNAAGEGPPSKAVTILPQQASAQFLAVDDRSQGDWKGKYGKDGFYIVGDWDSENNPSEPDYFRIDGAGFRRQAGFKARPVEGVRFLRKAAPGTKQRTSFPPGSGYAKKEQEYLLEFVDGKTHRLTLYAAGHGNGYATKIELVDATTGTVLDQREIAARGERQGKYISWNVQGALRLRYNHIKGKGFGNFLAGFFFDLPKTP